MSKSTELHAPKSPTTTNENIPSALIISSPTIGKLKGIQSLPYPTKIIGVLQELKDDIVNKSHQKHLAGDYIHHISGAAPKTGLTDVYIEHNGRFTKASKEISEQDFNNDGRYVQPVDPEYSYNTPLDMAIYAQKLWTLLSKILFGLLAGVALFDLILLHFHLEVTRNWDVLEKFLEIYSPLSFIITKYYHIILTICLITLFDWFDLAHMNVQHLADTIQFRKIWIVTIIYFVALVAALYNFSSDDLMILYDNIKEYIKQSENLDYTFYSWMVAKKICCWSCLIGWIFIILTNNEDLFLIHLMAMKKYDYVEEDMNQVYENINAIP